MPNLLSKVFLDSYPYFNEVSLSVALKIVDIILLDLEVDITNDREYEEYVEATRELTSLLSNFLVDKLDEAERRLFNVDNIVKLKKVTLEKREGTIARFRQGRKAIYEKYDSELLDTLVKQYKKVS